MRIAGAVKRLTCGALLAALSTVLASCGGSSGPTAPNCQNLAGSYNATVTNSCGGIAQGTVVVAQNGCSFTAAIPGTSTVTGTINGNSFTFTGSTAAPCAAPISGSGMISTSAVNGTFQGTSAGGFGCCPAGQFSGSFTLTRQ